MRDKLIISASGPDRKGIVSEISSIINQFNGNIETSRMIRLEEQFSILILIEIENINTKNLKNKIESNRFNSLVSRITEETRRSIEIASLLIEEYDYDPSFIEVHLDVSPFTAGNATSKFSEMLKGYVQGHGLDYKLKPDAWASQSIADKHSK